MEQANQAQGEDGFSWAEILGGLGEGRHLTRAQARAAMDRVMTGQAAPSQIAALIVLLRAKGETAEEILGLVEGMRAAATAVDLGDADPVDIVGTGGDRSGTFNVSTTASFAAAGAGVSVAKHGNRSMSSQCGSADLLEELGVAIDLPPERTRELFRRTGYAFFLAPVYHPAMRWAGPVRKELGVPTVFNFLGPLSNPAGVRRLAVGTSDGRMAERMIETLRAAGAVRALVFHGEDGLDELSLAGPSVVWSLREGRIARSVLEPAQVGLAAAPLESVRGGGVSDNAAITRSVLEGRPGPARDMTVLNAAAAILVSGVAEGWAEAAEAARRSLDGGAAAEALSRVVAESRELAGSS